MSGASNGGTELRCPVCEGLEGHFTHKAESPYCTETYDYSTWAFSEDEGSGGVSAAPVPVVERPRPESLGTPHAERVLRDIKEGRISGS